MKYQYRWYYAAVISFIIALMGYIDDLNPMYMRLKNMRQSGSDLLKKLTVYRQKTVTKTTGVAKNVVRNIESSPYLSNILALVSMSGLILQTVKLPAKKSAMELIQLTASGQFHQVTALFYAVARQSYPVIITDFSYKKDEKNIFFMTMDVLVWNKESSYFLQGNDHSAVLPGPHNPFCVAENTVLNRENDAAALTFFALAQMKMHGYLQQGKRSAALILLPNNSLVAVENGAVIGKESAIVTDIFRDHIQFLLPDRQKKSLTLSR